MEMKNEKQEKQAEESAAKEAEESALAAVLVPPIYPYSMTVKFP